MRRTLPLALLMLAACPDFHLGDSAARFACNQATGEDCGDSGTPFLDGGSDAGTDAGLTDAGIDAGLADAGDTDAGASDAGSWRVETHVAFPLYAIFGVDSQNILAVGQAGNFTYWNGANWLLPTRFENSSDLVSVWEDVSHNVSVATASGDVWRTHDLSGWGTATQPCLDDPGRGLSLYGTAAGTVWAGCAGGVQSRAPNFSSWTVSPGTPTDIVIHALWASRLGDVWIAGSNRDGGRALMYTKDGGASSAWVSVTGDFSNNADALLAFWGQDDNSNTLAVGIGGGVPQIFWNGSSRVTSVPGTGALRAATASANNFWVAGDDGQIYGYNSSTGEYDPQTTGTTATITGMWALNDQNAWAVTDAGDILRYHP